MDNNSREKRGLRGSWTCLTRNPGESLLAILVWGSMSFFGLWSLVQYTYWITNPFPNEYREGAGWHIVEVLNQGINPFSLDAPPTFFYMYGFVNAWLATGLSWLTGGASFLLIRLITLICSLLAGLLVAHEVRRRSQSVLLTVLAFLSMGVTVWMIAPVVARPDQLGLLLGLYALVLTDRAQSTKGLILPAFLTVAAFFTKQYFLLIGAEIFIYLLFVSKKRAFNYGLFAAGFLAAGILLVQRFYPCYFAMSVLAFGGGGSSLNFLMVQLRNYGAFYWPVLGFVAASFIVILWRSNVRFNLLSWNKPLIILADSDPNDTGERWTVYHASFIVAGLAMLWVGQSDSALQSYFYQLLLPATLVVGLPAVARYCSPRWRMPVLLLICICSLFHYNGKCNFVKFLSPAEEAVWDRAYAILAPTGTQDVCIETPVFADYAIKHEKKYFHSGLRETGSSNSWLVTSFDKLRSISPQTTDFLFPSVPRMIEKYQIFQREISDGISTKRFSLIVTDQISDPQWKPALEKNYTLAETLILKTGAQSWRCDFWRPKE